MRRLSLPHAALRTDGGNPRQSDRRTRQNTRLIELPDEIDLAFDKTELFKDSRDEPLFLAAIVPQCAEAPRLDPKRVNLTPETAPPKHRVWRGSIGSLLLHSLPLLALISWLRPPLPLPTAIPVQLVIEQPPPPPPPAKPPSVAKPPPPSLRASEDFGEVGPPSVQRGADTAPPTKGEAPPPSAQTPTAQPTPEPPIESAEGMLLKAPPMPPKPTPPKQQAAARPPKLEGLELPLPLHPDQPHQAAASARFPGPNATRDEYCAYALHLTTQHIDLVPLSLLGARRADTTVLIRVREDGTIIDARVLQGSGYLDIDDRVVAMVKAVRQYPPFPLWLKGPTADFTLHIHFPNPLQH